MIEVDFLESQNLSDFELEALLEEGHNLATASKSNLTFHQFDFARLWWKHFNGIDGSEFSQKRGRNFFGTRSFLEKSIWVVARDKNVLCGIIPMVVTRVVRKGNKPELKVLSFCADSVQVFYQDILVSPEKKDSVLAAILEAFSVYVSEHHLLLFLGYIPSNSPNLLFLQKFVAAKLELGWVGGLAISQSRGGVYPWNIFPLSKAISLLKDSLGLNHSDAPALEDLISRLDAQTSALLVFGATRKAFENELSELVQKYQTVDECKDALEKIKVAVASELIKYPYLNLPKTKDEYFESMSSSKRYYFRRYLKKFIEAGGSFEVIEPGTLTIEDVKDYLQLHAERWGKDSIAVNEVTISFHTELVLQMSKKGSFRLFFALCGGRRLAAHACFDIHGRREYFFGGRVMDADELRAGKLLVMHTILDAIERGFSLYDFGYGGDEYKADFTKDFKHAYNAFICNDSELFDPDGLFTKYEEMNFNVEIGNT